MGGYNLGFEQAQNAFTLHRQNQEAQRVAARDAQAKLIETAMQNPNITQEDTQKLINQHMALFQPHEAPSLIARLGGLIHGQKQQPAAAAPAAPQTSSPDAAAAPATEAESTQPQYPNGADISVQPPAQYPPVLKVRPFASEPHPVLSTLHQGLDEIGNHLKGFVHPVVAAPTDPAGDASVLARNFVPTERTKREDVQTAAQNLQNITGQKTTSAENIAHIRAQMGSLDLQQANIIAQARGFTGIHDPNMTETELNGIRGEVASSKQNSQRWEVRPDNQSQTGWSSVLLDQHGGVLQTVPNAAPIRGAMGTDRNTTRTDEAGEQTHTNTSTRPNFNANVSQPAVGTGAHPPVSANAPQMPAASTLPPTAPTNTVPTVPAAPASLDALQTKMNGQRTSAAPPSAHPVATPRQPISTRTPLVPGQPIPTTAPDAIVQKLAKTNPTAVKFAPPPALDKDGRIPATAANHILVGMAQNLMDGADRDKLSPKKWAPDAEALARKFGWDQGPLTPKEEARLGNSIDFLQRFKDSPALKVLDSPASRAKIASVLEGHEGPLDAIKPGFLSPDEQRFLSDYQAAVGNLGGIAGVSRGAQATVSSTIQTMNELPSVFRSANSADAKRRIDNAIREANNIRNFKPRQQPASSAAPAAPSSGGGSDIDAIVNALKKK